MNENNGETTSHNDGQHEGSPQGSQQFPAAGQPQDAHSGQSETPASAPDAVAGDAPAAATVETSQPTTPQPPAAQPTQPIAAQQRDAQQSAAVPAQPYGESAENTLSAGAPNHDYPAYNAPAQGAHAATPATPEAPATQGAQAPYRAPSASVHASASAAENPTERIPAPTGQQGTGNWGTPNATEPIPMNFAAAGTGTPGGHEQGNNSHGAGHAGPGYPASNAYPHTLAPAVTATPKERKKVGMGLFASSVLAAALVGGLVAGGTMFLVDQSGNNTVAGSNQQSSPLVINNPNSVNEVSAAAAKAMPSVVTISATSGTSGGTGSGIILSTDGYILTNTHVVTLDGAAAHAAIEVQTSDNKVYKGTIVGTDPLSDLAVIKIDAPNLVPAALGDSSKINVGDSVIAIGSPLGLNGTVTDGIVSTLNRTIQVASSAVPETPSDSSEDPSDGGNGFRFSPPGGEQSNTAAQGTVNLNVIQTDAAINPGNSGGALVNTEGQIIGVNVAIASTGSADSSSSQSGNIGVGFSIPIDHAKRVAEEIIKSGKASHGQLGVSVAGTSSTGSNSSFSTGATVADVTAGTAAAKAGLQKGDVITKLGERTISDPADLTAAVREQAGGATVKVDFTRGGKSQSVDVTLDTMTAS
ncbi:S1C family serine protease [Arthrobacter glacialis]|nr:trypsin-like peptidase domain-containing protein [Arthrobacter glacialis]